jgi:hypothetical protein
VCTTVPTLEGVRRLAVQPTWKILLVLVGISAALRAWAGEAIPTPWIAPDELIYAELGRSLWATGHLTLLGYDTGYFSFLYPAFAGLPLSLDDRQTGYDLLRALQAIAMSLAAVPVYFWGRQLVSRGWAIAAAALVLAPAGLAYSGLVMTEVAFYPLFVLAAWALARAVAQPTPRTQALALGAGILLFATRLQAIVLVPAYVTAVALDAFFARSSPRLRVHVPLVGGISVLGVLWSAYQLRNGGPVTKVFGAYQAAGETGYDAGAAVRFVVYHFADLVLISGVVPFCALVILTFFAAARGEDDPRVRAFLATTLALTFWVTVQVGIFASRHVGHAAERNLFPLLPLLLLALVLWLNRGAPRPRLAGAVAAVLALLLLVVFPFESFTTVAATPSAFTQISLLDLAPRMNLDLVVPLAAAALLAVCALLPRRYVALGLPVLLLALGAASSVRASRFIIKQSEYVQYLTIGPDKTWIDDNAKGSVTYLYEGQTNWEIAWQALFWNRRFDSAARFLGVSFPGNMPSPSVGPNADGTLVNDRTGEPLQADYVVASEYFAVDGVEITRPRPDIALWRVDGPPRLKRWLEGVAYEGLVPDARARLYVYACNGGTLRGWISSDVPRTVTLSRNGLVQQAVALKPGDVRHVEITLGAPDPVGAACIVELKSDGPFYLRQIGFS